MLRKGSRDYRGIIVLHPHLSVLDIVLDCVQDFFGIRDAHDLELHVPELNRVEYVVMPGDDDGTFVVCSLSNRQKRRRKKKCPFVPCSSLLPIIAALINGRPWS